MKFYRYATLGELHEFLERKKTVVAEITPLERANFIIVYKDGRGSIIARIDYTDGLLTANIKDW